MLDTCSRASAWSCLPARINYRVRVQPLGRHGDTRIPSDAAAVQRETLCLQCSNTTASIVFACKPLTVPVRVC